METLLLSLYPKQWRKEHGSEYRALLEDTGTSPSIILDVLKYAFMVQIQQGKKTIISALCAVQYFASVSVCMRCGLTANILWAPTTPIRALGLILTITPLIYLAYIWSDGIRQYAQIKH